ncbi:MAG: trigger factor [Phycisphaerales bacterium]|nr:trigger factor [Phycisphaerales bacterium]
MSTATTVENTIKVSDAGPALKRIDISIPAAKVSQQIESAFAGLRADAVLPGFRKGHAPRGLLEKRFGAELLQEARQRLVAQAYQEALESNKIRPIGQPEVAAGTAEPEFAIGKDFFMSVEVEVMPEFEIPVWEGIALRRPMLEIEPKHVEEEIERLSYRLGVPAQIEGPFEPLDRMVGKAVVRLVGEEKAFFETESALAVVPAEADAGKGPFLGLLVDGLDKILLGKKVGDVAMIQMIGPESHEIVEVRGKPLDVQYTITAAERIVPATRDEIASKIGMETIDLLNENIKGVLERRRDDEQRSALRDQVFEQLAAKVDFELPARLSEAQVGRELERQRLEMLYRGVEADRVEARLAETRAASTDETRRKLKLFFILAKLAETLGVEATEGEVNGRIAAIARSRGMRPDAMRAELEKNNRVSEIALQVREHKAADRVISKAVISDIPAQEWNDEAKVKAEGKTLGGATTAKKPAKGNAKS